MFFFTNFSHLWAPDAMKYAQAARSFLGGGGFDRGEVWPMSLAAGGGLHDQTQAFLHPLVIAPLFFLAGPGDAVVALASGVFFILSAPLVYSLGRRLFGATAAILTVALFLCEPWTLYYTVSGLSEPLFTFLMLALFYVLASGRSAGSLRRYILAGAILGLSYLTRPVALVFIPAVLIYAFFDRNGRARRSVRPAAATLSFACVALALLASFGALGEIGSERNSFHLMTNTPGYPGHTYVRSVEPVSFLNSFAAHPDAHLGKWIHQLDVMRGAFFHGLANPLIVALFVTFPLVWAGSVRALRLFALLAGMIILQAGLAAITTPATRYLHLFVPLAIVFGSGSLAVGARRLFPKRPKARRALLVLAVICASYPFAYSAPLDRQGTISRPYTEIHDAKDYESLGGLISENTKKDDVVLCDAPWIVAWYGNRTSIWLPNSPKDMEFLNSAADIKWLFLTQEYPLPRAWRPIFDRIAAEEEDPDWEFTVGVEDGPTHGYLFRARGRPEP